MKDSGYALWGAEDFGKLNLKNSALTYPNLLPGRNVGLHMGGFPKRPGMFVCLFVLMAAPLAYGSSWTRLNHSCSCQLMPQLAAMLDL